MLALCKDFFSHLNEAKVRYCHWKSNEHLHEALMGKTDIDILVCQEDQVAFEKAMRQYDFKKILSQPEKQFPYLEDYMGFDPETGRFVHLHVHYRLVLGQKYIKNHLLPIESIFFSNLIEKDGVKIPRPEIELILLVIRAHVKTDLISLLKHMVKDVSGQAYTAFPQDIEHELRHLIEVSDQELVHKLLKEMKLPLEYSKLVTFFERVRNQKLRAYHIFGMQRYILSELKDYRRAKSLLIYVSYFGFFLNSLSIVSRFKKQKKKSLIGEGRVISIIGADGSGKSTLTKDITKWLSWKLAVGNYYYGIPKSRLNSVFSYGMKISRKLGASKLRRFIQCLFWLYVAKERVKVSEETKAAKMRGEFALTDRYPLEQFRSMPDPMDGPRLVQGADGIESLLADREQVMYNSLYYPDLLIVLQVDLEVLRTRKKDLPSPEDHALKASAVNNLNGDIKNVVTIDANQSYEQVLLEVKREIWSLV